MKNIAYEKCQTHESFSLLFAKNDLPAQMILDGSKNRQKIEELNQRVTEKNEEALERLAIWKSICDRIDRNEISESEGITEWNKFLKNGK